MQKPPQNISRGNPHDCLIRSRKKVFDKFNSCSFKNNTVSTLGKGKRRRTLISQSGLSGADST